MLIRNLPREASLTASVYGEEADWSPTDHLLAVIADLLAAANWQRAGNKTAPKPKPIERPGQVKRLRLSGHELHRRLLEQRERESERRG